MRSYTVNAEPVKISVNGAEFNLLKADAVAQAEIVHFISHVGAMNIESKHDVQAVLRTGSELIDSLLGSGACYEIFGNTPISLGHIMALLTQICKDCMISYHKYLQTEYLED